MQLKGKKMAFLGDSITEGCGVADFANVYFNRIAARTGAEVFGYGISGTKIAAPAPSEDDPCSALYFASRVDGMIPDADVVVVFGGTNDFGWGNAPLGCMADRVETTFYGAYHLLLQKLFARYPEATLVVMTPLHRLSEDDVDFNEVGVRRMGPLKVYVQAIREVAEYYGVPVVDLYANCPIQPKVEVLRQRYMPDGVHPNDAGQALVADRLLGVLSAL